MTDERHHFEKEFSMLRAELSKMVSLVTDSIEMASVAFENLDRSMSKKILDLDDEIDNINREIENLVLDIIARFNPLGKDLRYTIAAMKLANNLERIGDHACNFAEKTLWISENLPEFKPSNLVKQMFGEVINMLQKTVLAFSRRDIELAKETWKMDDIIDDLDKKVTNDVERFEPHTLVLNVLFARDLERVADHLTNICEEIVFIETGKELKNLL
ncbi:phosphate uptake regulator, PhoU [Fervidobacterium changbaicum]|uniref:Phosphate-specific transport system accessory protein PhoU n=1 Tax=Fervidobacterium changbaicum TaxID=310769 RepID=A0ABX5QSU4_9BACT|nr:phosphate signaling complex protein PhoU [Fervidobacterium changbaicum]QAV33402.1 phosphate transport system regulatory protein PhoU [Fervidobacterium changbaicum]SDG91301.1 phosphate uptake regulator, PhoU [Fervidobacterium changbaicum]